MNKTIIYVSEPKLINHIQMFTFSLTNKYYLNKFRKLQTQVIINNI